LTQLFAAISVRFGFTLGRLIYFISAHFWLIGSLYFSFKTYFMVKNFVKLISVKFHLYVGEIFSACFNPHTKIIV